MHELTSLSGVPLSLQPFKKVDDVLFYEIDGKDSPLTNQQKAEIISHLCQSQSHLMSRWKSELKKGLPHTRNFFAITPEGKLLIRESDIAPVIFAFDPNKKSAHSALMAKISEKLSLNPGLIMDSDGARLRIHGDKLDPNDFLKISLFMNEIAGETVCVIHENSKAHPIKPRSGSGLFVSIHNSSLHTKTQAVKESVLMPLSVVNLLMDYFKLDYQFPYLGQFNNSQLFPYKYLPDNEIRNSFYLGIAEAKERLGGVDVEAMLKSTDAQVCRHPVPSSIIPKSKM
jgi:hypothetical protein